MPALNLDQNILSAGADVSAGDWAQAAAKASLDFRGAAELKRGINLEAGIGVMGELSAGLRYFLAADLNAAAQASARLKGQIQAPLDLFQEAGLAVRLQAVAEAAVSIRLVLGLSIREFLELAQQDGRIDGLAYDLLVIFLEELDIQAGVMGKAAFSAMAYANIVLTGRLIEDPVLQLKPGFTISAEMGAGLKGGAGWQLFARLGFRDTRRLVGRSIDVLVDETVAQLNQQLHDDYARGLVAILRAPAKIGLRCAFEIGHALYDQAPTFADNSDELARQCVRVALEEMQKALLEMLIKVATDHFIAGLGQIGISEAEWDQSRPQRDALANLLRALPREPFAPTSQNLTYWTDLANAAVNLGIQLGGAATNGDAWVEPASILWGATQLMVASVRKIADAQARVSFLGGVGATVQAKAFGGALPGAGQTPAAIREHINATLGRSATQTIDQDALVEYLLRDVVLELLLREAPEAGPLIEIFAGTGANGAVAAAKVIMRNINAFVPKADGSGYDPKESLRVIADGLEAYIGARVQQELRPILEAELGDDPLVRLYVDEVILPSLLFTSRTLIRRTLAWSTGALGARDALREACSSIVMKVLGRSAVVTADVLIAAALEQVGGELNRQADAVRTPGGVANELATATGTDEELVGEIIEETLRIAADVFTPQPPAVRAKMRALMYDLLDTVPESADDNWVEQLQHDLFIPNERSREAIGELAGIAANQLVDVIVRFLQGVLSRVAELVLRELAEFVEAVGRQIQEWVDELAGLAADLLRRLLELPAQIAAIANQINALADAALAQVELALGAFSTASGRSRLIGRMRDDLVAAALAPLRSDPLYVALPAEVKTAAENTIRSAIATTVQDALVQPVLQSLAPAAAAAGTVVDDLRDLLADLRTVNPDANVSMQVRNMLLDRLEQAVRSWWGGIDPGIDLAFQFAYAYTPPKVWGVTRWTNVPYWPYRVPDQWGWIQPEDIVFRIDFDLGRIAMPVGQLVALVRDTAAGLTAFENAVGQIAAQLVELLEAEDVRAAAEVELDLVGEQHAQVQRQLEDASAAGIDVTILEPAPAALYESDMSLDILLSGVPHSYLGLGALEPQRVFVFLNDEPLDLAGFTIREYGAAEDGGRGISGGAGAWSVARLEEPLRLVAHTGKAWSRILATDNDPKGERKRAIDKDSLYRDSRDRRAGATRALARARLEAPGSASLATHTRIELGDRRRTKDADSRTGATRRPGQTFSVVAGRGLSFPTIMSPWLKEAVSADSAPGLRLTRIVKLSALRAGINKLAVVVVNGRSTSISRSVSFLASIPQRKAPDVIRVGNVRLAHDHLPADLRRILGLALDADAAPGTRDTKAQVQPRTVGDRFWLPAKRHTRKKHTAAIVDRQVGQLVEQTRVIKALRNVVRDGDLRPKVKHSTDASKTLK